MAAYPSTLPLPQHSGYANNPSSHIIRTEMEVGYARVRRVTSALNDRVSVTYYYTDANYVEFRAWFYSSTGANGGQAWFDAQLDVGLGTGLQTLSARFVDSYKATKMGGLNWQVTAELEVR